jgi:hypothetical protein
MANKEFVPYELASELKGLGFDEPCFGYWKMSDWLIEEKTRTDGYAHADQLCSAPLYQQAFRWFREKYNLRGFIGFRPNVKQFDYHIYNMSLSGEEYVKQRTMEKFNKDPKVGTYEEAELNCLIKLIEIVKENSK